MTITFIGHGYVGLVSAAVFADLGNTVWVIGHTKEKIDNLRNGIIPIYEPGLEEVVKRNVEAGRLLFTLDYDPAIKQSQVVFIAVGTPPKENGEADLSVVFDVAKAVGKNLSGETVVITKSTVPIGTNFKVKEIIAEAKSEDAIFEVASVPEFLREGQALSDTFHPDRIVIGTESKKAEKILIELHEGIDGELILTDIPTAEMTKYAANAFLATKISFANAIAQLSEKLGADGPTVLESIGKDKRIGKAFLYAGAGYGGSCFPKDVNALIHIARNNDYQFGLLEEVEIINKEAKNAIAQKAARILGNNLEGKIVAVLGLAFKPDTDDMRDAPSRTVIPHLLDNGAKVRTYDPVAMENAKLLLSGEGLTFCDTAYDALEGADLMILITEWNEFKELDFAKVKSLMRTQHILDGRNIYNPQEIIDHGFTYKGVGR